MAASHRSALVALMLPALCVSGDWVVARNAHFEIYSQQGEATARAALRWFSELRSAVLRETGLDVGGRSAVRVIGFDSESEYERYRPGPAADAYYVGAGDRNYIVMPSLGADRFSVAAHEYAHVVQNAAGSHLPPWLSEGLADLFSTVRIDARGSRIGGEVPGRLAVLRRAGWIPLAELMALPAHAPQRDDRAISRVYYAESWVLADMLALSPEYRPRFAALLAEVAKAKDSVAAVEKTYGKSLEAVTRDLHAWAAHYTGKPIPLASPEDDGEVATVGPTPAGVVELILAELLLSSGNADGAERLYREVSQAMPENAGAWAGLGTVAASRKQFDQARALWKQALDRGLSDPMICFRYAELLDDGSRREDRRAALDRAIALNPQFDDARWVLALLESNSSHPEAALAQLRAMREVAPARAYHYWCAVADALTALGRSEEAQAAAGRASQAAASAEERAHAAQIAYMARTRLAVRMSRDAAGNPRMVMTRVPQDTVEFNPFVEPGDDLRRVEGALREIQCGETGMRLVVETASDRLVLSIPDPHRVQMRHAPEEFVCGPQAGAAVTVEYAATKAREGIVRGVEFR